jgi:UDP:flavonoid glycosyltransferase YjiC (YdhE family)
VRIEKWVAQAELLPHLNLVVHQGSAGTTLSSLAAGVPQLFIPQGGDGFVNADVGEESVADLAKELLAAARYREAAERLAAEIAAMPSPAEVATRLPEFARG